MKTKKIIIALLTIGAIAGGFWMWKSTTTTTTTTTLLNPSVSANLGKHYIINVKPLRLDIEAIQKKYPQKTFIYFLYLNNGVWVGLNEKDEFTAASTLKVPLTMSVLKSVEDRKIRLDALYSLDELELDANFGELYKVGADKEFTLEELLKIMLEQSDNTAMNAISDILLRLGIDDPFGEVYATLGWQFLTPPTFDEQPNYSKINLKTLANMFLALYNSTFLEPKHSQKILKYLTQTPFNDKILAGVPEDIVVAHKIGTAGAENTFSDCGIVYAPNRNYLLCLGSNGGDEKRAAKFMAEVSTAVYKYVINN